MTVVPLTYADAGARPPMRPWYRSGWLRLAVVCWAVPLVAGLTIFAASEGARAAHHYQGPFLPSHGGTPPVSPAFTTLVGLGVLDLMAGGIATMLGGVAVVVFAWGRWSSTGGRVRPVIGPAVTMALLLASNFMVALALMAAASR